MIPLGSAAFLRSVGAQALRGRLAKNRHLITKLSPPKTLYN